MSEEKSDLHERLLVQHANLLLEHGLEVQARFRGVRVECVEFHGLFLPRIDVDLATLVRLWREGVLRLRLGDGEPVHVFRAAGSALSGSHFARGVELSTRRIVTDDLAGDLHIVELFRRLRFHAGPSRPPRSPVSFEEVIAELLAR